jgi:hypothetical protein
MHLMAQRLFGEASRRGAAGFPHPKDAGKLFRAHLEAQQMGGQGAGLGLPAGSELLAHTQSESDKYQQGFVGRALTRVEEEVAAQLQAVGWQVQRHAQVNHLHVPLLARGATSRGGEVCVVVQVIQPWMCLLHPAGQLFGKQSLSLVQVARGCDGVVLVWEGEWKQALLAQRLQDVMQQI